MEKAVASQVTYTRSITRCHEPLLGKVVRVAEQHGYQIAELTGNPHDQGTDWALLGPEINGATEFSLGLYKMEPNQIHPRCAGSRLCVPAGHGTEPPACVSAGHPNT